MQADKEVIKKEIKIQPDEFKLKKTASIKKNYLFSLTAKVVGLLVPLFIMPYVSRIIEPDGAGVCSYIASLVSYFVLFANLGIESYALREIAMHRDDNDFVKKFVIEVTIMKAILTAFCLGVYYLIFVAVLNVENQLLYIIYSITILSVAFNFTWFFQGVEKFGILAVSSILSKIVYVTLILVFVKAKSDIGLYAAIVVSVTFLEYLLSIPFIFRNVKGKINGKINPFLHLKGCLTYFLPTIAVEIYTVLDKTMIGLITKSDAENGFYEYADKLVKMPVVVLTSINAIMQSRMAYYYANGNFEAATELTKKSANLSFMLALPMAFGMAAIARTAIPVYLGAGYEKCTILVYILAWLIPIIAVSNLLGSHYYTPYGKRLLSAGLLAAGAVINVVLNSFMIFLWQSVGAAIASIVAELVITVLYVIFARKFFPVKELLKISYKYLIASIIMGVAVFLLNWYLPQSGWYLILDIGAGIIIYTLMLLILRTRFFIDNVKSVFKKLKKKKAESENSDESDTENSDIAESNGMNEEEICGFKVTEKRKQLWRIQTDMVKEVVKICENHNLKYVASGGTLLGAVRHQGFIPWDDDIDLMMPRSDYQKFLEFAPQELIEGYFLQYSDTEKFYANGHAQIRKGDTASFTDTGFYDLQLGKNCGIFIDIFPYDNVPDDIKERKKFTDKIRKLKTIAFRKIYKSDSAIKNLIKSIIYSPYKTEKLVEKINTLSQKYNGLTETVALVSFMPGNEKMTWKASLFDETEMVPFEDIKISVPKDYDKVLRVQFGDYTVIPENKNGTNHGKCFHDLDNSYLTYKSITKEQFKKLLKDFTL